MFTEGVATQMMVPSAPSTLTAPSVPVGRPTSGYLPYLDGLRGVAILMVLIFHAGGGLLNGGFIGVDIFFVLSGYLITLLLLREWDNRGRIHLRKFYARRGLRLLPAVVALLMLYAATGFGMEPDGRARVRDSLIVLFYAGNWVQAFGRELAFDLRHTWSLAIEEQFYLLWPVLLIGMLKLGWSRRTIGWVTLIGALTSAGWRAYLAVIAHAPPPRMYNGLDTRADGLLIGCALALLVSDRPRSGRLSGVCAVFLVVIALSARWQSPWMMSLGYLGVALASAGVVIGLQHAPGGVLRKITDWPPLIDLGRISYGVYLWHWPVFHVVGRLRKHFDLPARVVIVLLVGSAVSILVAWASYRWIEQPFLKLKGRFQ